MMRPRVKININHDESTCIKININHDVPTSININHDAHRHNHETCGYNIESIMIKMDLIKYTCGFDHDVNLIMIHMDSIVTYMDKFC